MKFLFTLSLLFIALLSQNLFAKEKKLKSVFVEKTKKVEIYDVYTYPTRIEPKASAVILSETAGVVKSIKKKLGESVDKNQVLASIKPNDPTYRSSYIKAPISGVVAKIFYDEGSFVPRGAKIIMVTDPKKIKSTIEVSLKDRGALTKDLKGELKIRSMDKAIPVEIIGISPFVDSATGTSLVELKIVGQKNDIPLGAIGKVSLKSNPRLGFLLPNTAIVYSGKKTYIRIVNAENIVSKQEIKLGKKRKDKIEIISGLKEEQTVIIKSSGYVTEKMKVKIKTVDKKSEG